MNIADFKEMWEKDGFKLVKRKETERKNLLWQLYAVYQPKGTEDYGRHFGMLLVVDKNSDSILAHDLTNEQYYMESVAPPSIEIENWFDRHVEVGLCV